jgi:hypothetical protein
MRFSRIICLIAFVGRSADPFRISGYQKGLFNQYAVKEKSRKTGLKGFEPLTCGLRVRRYAELSYRPTLVRPSNVVDNAE